MKNQQSGISSVYTKLKGVKELSISLLIIILIIGISIKAPVFLSSSNLKTTAIGFACDGIIAIGMTIALICGGFDLSVGSVMGLTAVVTASLVTSGLNIWLAVIIALIVALLIGFVNGFLIGKVGLNGFITTLGMMSIARGAVFVITQGSSLSVKGASDVFSFLGGGTVFGIPVIVIVFIILAIAGDFMVRRSSMAMKVFYTGSNEKASILSGINTKKVKLVVYMVTALFASIAGILALSRFGVATASMGEGSEMRVISAAVIGGASLNGGEGSVFGTILGVILLNIINNALVLFNVSVHWQTLISGTILIVAVTIDLVSHKRKVKASVK